MSDSLATPWTVARLLRPLDSPGKNIGVGCHFLLQRIFPTMLMEPASPALAGGFFTTEPPGKTSTTGNRSQRITTQVKQRHAILHLRAHCSKYNRVLYISVYINAFFFAELVKRHAGVLGLGACVLSSPYDVPTWMPQLLMNLSAHLNDPQPIEVKFSFVGFFAHILTVIIF